MSVNFEIKGMLARLLAMEDLIVENKNVQTACFNVQSRVLTLPRWEKASATVYDMLVAHEVSHALYSPNTDLTSYGVPHHVINIVEDIRVEKLIKRRYAGLAKTFYAAYKEFSEKDFFSIGGDDISTYSFADRLNLYFKIGNFISVPFNEEELEIRDKIAEIETFEEVVEFSKTVHSFSKKQIKDGDDIFTIVGRGSSGSGVNLDPFDFYEENDEDEENDDVNPTNEESEFDLEDKDEESEKDSKDDEESEESEEDEGKTVDALQDAIDALLGGGFSSKNDIAYVEVPSLNLDVVVAKNKDIHDCIENHFSTQQKSYDARCSKTPYLSNLNVFETCDSEYKNFKTSAQREVNYLVKEFECRKAADSYSRSLTSRTGVLDCTKLYTYKYNEDIFKKVTTLPDSKNHGLIFVLDWSGSMADELLGTVKQLFNLVWFCKKVAIPFDVYAFTEEWSRRKFKPEASYQKKKNLLCVKESFNMMNLLTSKVNGTTLEIQMKNLWRVVWAVTGNNYMYSHPPQLGLSGTPLNEALISLHEIIPEFKNSNKLQKVHCVILTDGEGSPIPYHVEIKKNEHSAPYIGNHRVVGERTYLRDKKLGTTYMFMYEYYKFTDLLIRNLNDRFPSVNFISIRIMGGRDASDIVNRYYDLNDIEREYIMNKWRKDRSYTLDKTQYTRYFGIASNSLNQNASFDVKEGSSKSAIKQAFSKSLTSKKLNKKILSEFINVIA